MTAKKTRKREYRVRVRAVRRQQPDFKKLAAALVAIAQAEAEAAAEHQQRDEPSPSDEPPRGPS